MHPNSIAEVSGTIERASYVPMYIQLSEILERLIASGGYRVGSRLPSEPELCAAYQVSRMTVRQAVSLLVERGLVRPERGRGVFVEGMGLPQAHFSLDGIRGVFDKDAAVDAYYIRTVEADRRVADELMIAVGDPAVHLRSVLRKRGKAIAYHDAFLVDEPALLEAERALNYFRGLFGDGTVDSPYRSANIELQTANISDAEAEALGREPGAAAWVLEHTFFSADGRILSWGRFVLPSEVVHFPTRIGLVVPTIPRTRS